MRLVLLDTLFRNSGRSEEHLIMEKSTTYGADLRVESLETSLFEGL